MPKLKVKQILELIDDEYLRAKEEQTGVNYQVSKMEWIVMFKLLLMSLLSPENTTLRALETMYSSPEFDEFVKKWKNKTRHSTIADRIWTMNPNFFKEIFEDLSVKYSKELNEKINNINKIIKKFDSTLVWLWEKLLKFWIRTWGKKERHIKFTIWLEWYIPIKAKIYTRQEASSEDIALWETILEEINKKNEIIVFDRWVQKRETYSKLIDKDIDFVTRLRKNVKYKVVKQNKEIKWRKAVELILESDEIVKLYTRAWKELDKEMRMIVAYRKNEEKSIIEKYIFLTNILELNAIEITEIYARRWDIEVFFKFIKQEFWFSHFVSRSENWIINILYMTLIAAILVIVYKEKNGIKSYKEAKRIFVAELNELILIDITIASWWDIKLLKKKYLRYYCDD